MISAWKKAVADAPKNAKQLNGPKLVTLIRRNQSSSGVSFVSRLAAKPEPSNAIGR